MSVRFDVSVDDVDPQLVADLDELFNRPDCPGAWAVVSGVRSSELQAVLYIKHLHGGPLAAPPGQSAHEVHEINGVTYPGQAVDVAHLSTAGTETYNYEHDPAWAWLWAQVKAHPRLHSGHEFPPVAPADDDHIQTVKWWAIEAMLKSAGIWNVTEAQAAAIASGQAAPNLAIAATSSATTETADA